MTDPGSAEPLLVVDDAYALRGKGVMLGPRLKNAPAERKLRVKLERPDGSTQETTAEVETAHIRGPNGAFGLLRLPELTEADVPLGTKIWRAGAE